MKYLPIFLLTLVFGVICGYFQYWMATRLDRKRWLLLLQPGLFVLIALCFAAWTMGNERLKDSPARFAAVPFVVLLVLTLAGWAAAGRKKK